MKNLSFDEMVTDAVEKVIPSVVNISEVKLIRDAYLNVHPVPGVGSGFIIDLLLINDYLHKY